MVVQLVGATCGAVIMLAVSSAAMARTENDAHHSYAIDRVASGVTIVGAASMYNPYRPGYREGGADTAQWHEA